MSGAGERAERRLCALNELSDPGSRAFTAGSGDWPLRGFLVRRADQVFAYVNRCPHAGHPLNWRPDQFLARDGSLIQCQSHGALFEIPSGVCVGGPCPGRKLTQIPIRVERGDVVLDADPEALARAYV
ncbi:MAG TPA: Rieske (2Fe-2S) protein [Steroidobacter sp.]|jgi:nitrite reductase/ring-hydroxylating ferredoxin subunit|nr:Rieske (2Fe-2S) protein [Steroidobacter sp.]